MSRVLWKGAPPAGHRLIDHSQLTALELLAWASCSTAPFLSCSNIANRVSAWVRSPDLIYRQSLLGRLKATIM